MKAYSLLPARFEDKRHEAMEEGLRKIGYTVTRDIPKGAPGDVLIGWGGSSFNKNRWHIGQEFEKAGGKVIYAEEGYFRNVNGEKYFALALGGHNGAGSWNIGGPERWASFNIELSPWREDGNHILVCGQRGIGTPEMASPEGWHEKTAQKLRTERPVIIRWHPKYAEPQPPLDEQLEDAWAVVVWSSACSCLALVKGIPVFVSAPHHVLDGAVNRSLKNLESPDYPDRLPAFQRMAWAQWSMSEIESGEAFRWLLQ